jgi:hypothetical protein
VFQQQQGKLYRPAAASIWRASMTACQHKIGHYCVLIMLYRSADHVLTVGCWSYQQQLCTRCCSSWISAASPVLQ